MKFLIYLGKKTLKKSFPPHLLLYPSHVPVPEPLPPLRHHSLVLLAGAVAVGRQAHPPFFIQRKNQYSTLGTPDLLIKTNIQPTSSSIFYCIRKNTPFNHPIILINQFLVPNFL